MNKLCYLVVLLFCIAVLPSTLAQSYTWLPGGAFKGQNNFSFREGDDFSGKDFSGSVFENMGDIVGVNLDNSNWEGSYWAEMTVRDTSFRGANLRFVNAAHLTSYGTGGHIGGMPGCDFTDADITGSNLPLNAVQLRSTKNYKRLVRKLPFRCNLSFPLVPCKRRSGGILSAILRHSSHCYGRSTQLHALTFIQSLIQYHNRNS